MGPLRTSTSPSFGDAAFPGRSLPCPDSSPYVRSSTCTRGCQDDRQAETLARPGRLSTRCDRGGERRGARREVILHSRPCRRQSTAPRSLQASRSGGCPQHRQRLRWRAGAPNPGRSGRCLRPAVCRCLCSWRISSSWRRWDRDSDPASPAWPWRGPARPCPSDVSQRHGAVGTSASVPPLAGSASRLARGRRASPWVAAVARARSPRWGRLMRRPAAPGPSAVGLHVPGALRGAAQSL
jgi:hypothetical protein